MSSVTLVPFYLGGREDLLGQLRSSIQWTFQVMVQTRAPWFDPGVSFDHSRRQYNANVLLRELLTDPDGEGTKILGVTGCDLFAPALTYVFGEAQLNGRAGIVSIERLRSEAYGLYPNDRLLRRRLQKEAIHELGHTYGLVHCRDASCVMHASTWAEQIDFKSARFCIRCLINLAAPRS
jgi:archaemetzincin